MHGAVLSDIVCSPYGPANLAQGIGFPLFSEESDAGAASFATIAVGYALVEASSDSIMFVDSLEGVIGRIDPEQRESMLRVPLPACCSSVGWAFDEDGDISKAVDAVASVFGSDAEGARCAKAVACAVRSCRMGDSRFMVRRALAEEHGLACEIRPASAMAAELDPIWPSGGSAGEFAPDSFTGAMDGTELDIEAATVAGLESSLSCWGFEHAVRDAVCRTSSSVSAVVAGSVAEAYFTVPDELKRAATRLLSADYSAMLDAWDSGLWEKRQVLRQLV